MKDRKLRIVWSVAWAVAAVLLIVLWVRSYWREYVVYGPITSSSAYSVNSLRGAAIFRAYSVSTKWPQATNSFPVLDPALFGPGQSVDNTFGFEVGPMVGGGWVALVPYLFLVSLSVIVGVTPWLRWSRRFSLRTLLIATTLIAVGLGLIVWAAK
jgi:hypothetical protein